MPKPTAFQQRLTGARNRRLLAVVLGAVVFVLCLVNAVTNFDWLSVTLTIIVGLAMLLYLAKWREGRR